MDKFVDNSLCFFWNRHFFSESQFWFCLLEKSFSESKLKFRFLNHQPHSEHLSTSVLLNHFFCFEWIQDFRGWFYQSHSNGLCSNKHPQQTAPNKSLSAVELFFRTCGINKIKNRVVWSQVNRFVPFLIFKLNFSWNRNGLIFPPKTRSVARFLILSWVCIVFVVIACVRVKKRTLNALFLFGWSCF